MICVIGTLFAGLLGLCFGSFLNVCLSRWPAGESVVRPGSHCRSCGRMLAWWENVPVVSWLVLRARCRTCESSISWRYPLVELAVGALWAIVTWQAINQALIPREQAFSIRFVSVTEIGKLVFTWVLVGLAALDAEDLWLPDIVTLPGIMLGVASTLLRGDFLLGQGLPSRPLLVQLLNIAFAILFAGGLVLLIRWIYWLIRRREGVGLGDAKLMAMLAAWLGLHGALLSFGLGVFIGAILALVLLIIPDARQGDGDWGMKKLPLGTFLCAGGIISTLWGQTILTAYLRWAGF